MAIKPLEEITRSPVLELTKDEAYAIAEFIDINLLSSIRNNDEVDNVLWFCNLVRAFEKLGRYGRYPGFEEENSDGE